ncbi:hypothetical protein ABT160_25935 [Streptomyces sp. NPDC001941]|uniref:hypothetical protein n=1 Tax=Streptomyces sp. NPDC001941 TaxID=3154659 RepID=UPI00332A00F6
MTYSTPTGHPSQHGYPGSSLAPEGQPYVLTDAFGRTCVSSAPVPAPPHAVHAQTPAPACGCSHGSAHTPAPQHRLSPAAMVAVGAGGVLVVGAVVVALLLSVAVVAASVATCAVALAVCAVVMRSLLTGPAPHRGRYRR